MSESPKHTFDEDGNGVADFTDPTLPQDARDRARRSLIQGLLTTAILSVAVVLMSVFSSARGWEDLDGKVIGFMVTQSLLVAVASWVMRYLAPPEAMK